ncbi:heavy metal translocating P-type ATPase [Xanthobacter oligotrophicus]|uniref:heavy metal translocating P-type ATPase n=1 Tax=Xanthobacter oligotrophicus TaxID=2607286 RepID=UPI0011F1C68E|nr:heavy metal translocating P-type ATPase [Xanthobacter oligotrophicus]MCG5235580.1 cadmium-translocating P-type ATPase [Xanthobacter oligotrophicus]
MAEAIDYSIFVARSEDGLAQMSLAVDGIDCAACIAEIEDGVKALPGVVRARLNYSTHRLTVAWREETSPDRVVSQLEALGYRAHPFAGRAEESEARHARWLLRCLGVAGFAAMNIMLLSVSVWSGNVTDITPETRDFFHWVSALIALPAAAYAGQPFFQSAFRAVRSGRLNMDVPITIGVTLALGMSVLETALSQPHAYFDSAIMLLFFLLAGRYLDHEARRRTRATAGNIAALRGEMAHRLGADGVPVLVPVQALQPGDTILVAPGERVAADGVIASGQSSVDESLVTGETLPRALKAGDAVYAGSLNGEGALHLKVTAGGENTLVDDVQRLLDGALAEKGAYVRLADRVARLYAPMVHLTALVSAIGWLLAGAGLHHSVMIAVAVLIITCPCALALAVPAVQVTATGRLFRAGLLINAGDMLERLAAVDTVVFDKTGTLTLPEPALALPRGADRGLVGLAGRLALSSRHPLARALAPRADGPAIEGVTEVSGQGVEAVVDGAVVRLGSLAFCGAALPGDLPAGASLIALRRGAQTLVMGVEQALRPDALEVVAALKARGLEVRILSGDREAAVVPVAQALGITHWDAGLKPADKIAALDRLKADGRRVLMVGDGLNDAPALAAATVSLSPATGAAVTQAHADAVFLGRRLAPVLAAVDGARVAARLMRQNLAIAVLYNVIAVPLAIAGFVTPLVAALAMSGSSILVTVNALRAARPGRKDEATDAAAPAGGDVRTLEEAAA